MLDFVRTLLGFYAEFRSRDINVISSLFYIVSLEIFGHLEIPVVEF